MKSDTEGPAAGGQVTAGTVPGEAKRRTRRARGARMIGWYHPPQLARTGIEVLVSTIFGRHADTRLMEALASGSDAVFDYTYHPVLEPEGQPKRVDAGEGAREFVTDATRPRDEIWIDYVGDTGDGWNSTYAIAYQLAHPDPSIRTPDQRPVPRGAVLVFGGDEVYPTASRDQYDGRLVKPYVAALSDTPGESPHVFAIPGNHDWYDSLVSYSRLFVSQSWFGGWFAPQTRSYFALKLPHRWWLLGTDVQLGSDIDGPQVEYFKQVAARMQPGDHVILCVAEPDWVFEAMYAGHDAVYSQTNLAFLERIVLKNQRVAVMLAGDLHHYRRHASASGLQKITCGGGGAFLHPTHPGLFGGGVETLKAAKLRGETAPAAATHEMRPDEAVAKAPAGASDDEVKRSERRTDDPTTPAEDFELIAAFPKEEVSRRLCYQNLLFPLWNWTFMIVPAVVYLLLSWFIRPNYADVRFHPFEMMGKAWWAMVASPGGAFLVVAVFFGFILFTETHARWYRWVGGGIHALAHLFAALVAGWSAAWLWELPAEYGNAGGDLLKLAGAVLHIMIFGGVVGSTIMGVYLLVSLNAFGRHTTEAFSSLKVEDWKSFLKLHIDRNGDLWIYPVGIERVPRDWDDVEPVAAGEPAIVPSEADVADVRTRPRLIEGPVKVPGPKAGVAAPNAGS